ncbi:MAG: hypothetical protein QMD00_06375, partial [Hadesarchaea archaeon]|nr:hypothetical protein [Hadesarchaea archaeon]
MITRVKLKNWKSHRDTELRLGDGTNVLVGIMGSGKSLPYQELVVARFGRWGKYQIGEIVEHALKNAAVVATRGDTLLTTENPKKVSIQCLNPHTLKIEPREVRAFIKHRNSSHLIRLRTKGGRSITV